MADSRNPPIALLETEPRWVNRVDEN